MSGPVALWTGLRSTVLEPFGPASAYGAPALGGALAVCALYYVGRRRARGRRISISGFVRSIFPRRIVLHPSSLVDMRLWALNGVVLASAYGMLGLGLFFWRDAVVAALTHGVRAARARALARLDRARAGDGSASPGLRARLLVRPLLLP